MQNKIHFSFFTTIFTFVVVFNAAAQAPQSSADQLLTAGKKQQIEKKYDAAIKSFSECLNLDSSQSECYRERGRANLAKDDSKAAIADFTKAIRINPNDTEAYRWRALAHFNFKSLDLALIDLTKVIEISPTEADGYFNRANFFYGKEDYGKAVADYGKAIELDPKNAEYYFYRGISFAGTNQSELAIKDLTRAIEINAKYADALAIRGVIHFSAGKIDLALADLKLARQLEPQSVEVRGALKKVANYYLDNLQSAINAGELDSALANCSKAIEIYPELADSYYFRSRVYLLIRNKEKDADYYNLALKDAGKAVELLPHPELLANRSELYEKISNSALAIADLTQAIAVYSKSIDEFINYNIAAIYASRGRLHAGKQNYDAAIGDYSKSIDFVLDENDLPLLYYQRGVLYNKKSANDLMLRDFQTALEKDSGQLSADVRKEITETIKNAEIGKPNQTADDYIRSAAKYMSGDYPSADQLTIVVDLLTKAITLKPDSADLYKQRGKANLKRSKLEAAREDFSSAIKINSGDAELYALRGDTYGYPQIGTPNDALQISDWTAALALAPNDIQILEKRGDRLLMKAIAAESLASAKESDKDFEAIIKIKPDEESYRLQIEKRDYFLRLTESDYSFSYCEKSNWAREAVQRAYGVFQNRNSDFAKSLQSRLTRKDICDFSQIDVEVSNWGLQYEGRYYRLFIAPFGEGNTTFSSHPMKNGQIDFDRIYFSYRGEAKPDKKQRNRFYLVFNRGGATDEYGKQEKIDKITWTFELWGDEFIGTSGEERIVFKRGY